MGLSALQRGLILAHSARLRLITVALFYFTQGFPIGLFSFAIPAWMAGHGASTGQVAAVVGASTLPWTLKLANGFIIDRYAYLPMGRRRAWIVGAQVLLVLALLAGGLLAPLPTDVAVLSAIGFCANIAVTFQDVGIDSLAVDIMPEDERARAAGIMNGAQVFGIAAASAGGGWLLAAGGAGLGLAGGALVPGLVALFAIVMRERAGERALPWTRGQAHPDTQAVQVAAWWPLLKASTRAMLAPLSLLLLPLLLVRSMPNGAFESFHPVMFQQVAGWSATDYSNFSSIQSMISGVFSLTLGGVLVARAGAQRALIGAMLGCVAMQVLMGLSPGLWSSSAFLVTLFMAYDLVTMIVFIAAVTLAMRMCDPAVAATQFSLYMAIANFGRPLGASLAAVTSGAGQPQAMYLALAAVWLVVIAVISRARSPQAPLAAAPPRVD